MPENENIELIKEIIDKYKLLPYTTPNGKKAIKFGLPREVLDEALPIIKPHRKEIIAYFEKQKAEARKAFNDMKKRNS